MYCIFLKTLIFVHNSILWNIFLKAYIYFLILFAILYEFILAYLMFNEGQLCVQNFYFDHCLIQNKPCIIFSLGKIEKCHHKMSFSSKQNSILPYRSLREPYVSDFGWSLGSGQVDQCIWYSAGLRRNFLSPWTSHYW